MKTKLLLLFGCVSLAWLQPVMAQPLQYVGQWYMNEGSGTNLVNSAGTNWNMTIVGDPNLWGYQQPGAYDFANGGYAITATSTNAPWTNSSHLLLQADFNVCGNLSDPGVDLGGGGVFGADYFVPGGNSLGYNQDAFYAQVLTPSGGTPTIEFDISGVSPGFWSHVLPTDVTNANVNGGWHRAGWNIHNNASQNSMTLQFMLDGTNLGPLISITGGHIPVYSGIANYTGSVMEIGACAATYQAFNGALSNVTLTMGNDPSVSITPSTANVLPGSNVTFTGVAVGTPPFHYQWYFDNTNIMAGATNGTLTLSSVSIDQSGFYNLVVSNNLSTATATAQLLVFVPPKVQLHFYNGLIIQGTVGFNYLIQYTDAATGPGNWQTLTNLALPSSPYYWFDLQSVQDPNRTYQVVAAP